MLKLRKVEITGFKSFCERTVVTFSGTGTTCIVGPNGCGKSNVVDAISWVLGEQSHKSLRAGRMSDCIFNGTVKRPPMGLAEVTITLEDPELAEAARFVMESGASEEAAADTPADGPSAAPHGVPSEVSAERQPEPGEEAWSAESVSSQDAAQAADDGKSEFIKGKRRKKSE
ncbi:MAG TPA: AAA family ATPase, partial [Candidatus Acidoferrum sp.]|nr:AAA family ATPase [Candidatus Acidoferrum sp.]